MKVDKKSTQQDAVSPVVGVMLMLVVVIIIAAVVSAFAGGMTQSNERSPQVKISATFSQSNGMNIYHEGGDTVPVALTKFYIRTGQESTTSESTVYEVNLTKLGNMDYSCSWEVLDALPTTPYCPIMTFKAGDIAHMAPQYLNTTQTRPDGTVDYNNAYRGFGSARMVGNHVTLEMVDLKNHKIIATTKMQIDP